MARYIELLQLLLSYGPRLPEILASVQRIVDVVTEEVGKIVGILGLSAQAEACPELSAEAAALESQLITQMQGPGHGGPLSNLLALLKANPELVALLLSLLKR